MQVTEVAGNTAGGQKITAKAVTETLPFNTAAHPRAAHLYGGSGGLDLTLDKPFAPSSGLQKGSEIHVTIEAEAPAAVVPPGAPAPAAGAKPAPLTQDEKDYQAGVALKQAGKPLPVTANFQVRRGFSDPAPKK